MEEEQESGARRIHFTTVEEEPEEEPTMKTQNLTKKKRARKRENVQEQKTVVNLFTKRLTKWLTSFLGLHLHFPSFSDFGWFFISSLWLLFISL